MTCSTRKLNQARFKIEACLRTSMNKASETKSKGSSSKNNDIVNHGNTMIQSAKMSLEQEKNFKNQKLLEYRKAFKADYNMKQMMKQKQIELDKRLKDEHNMMFLRRAEQEINKEKEYKQHFIDCNRVQMIRSRAYLNSIGSSNKDDLEENDNIKIVKLNKHFNGGNSSNEFNNSRTNMNTSALAGNRQLLLNYSNDNIEKYYSMEGENTSLNALKQSEYKKILDSQIKLKKGDDINRRLERNKSQFSSNEANDYSNMAMIPGINSTSPLIKIAKEK